MCINIDEHSCGFMNKQRYSLTIPEEVGIPKIGDMSAKRWQKVWLLR